MPSRRDILKLSGLYVAGAPFLYSPIHKPNVSMPFTDPHDVLVIGGSYAGLSAAMSLARSMRTVLIIDSGQPCNRQTPHSHNVITLDGTPPAQIALRAKEQVLAYPTVTYLTDKVVSINNANGTFEVKTERSLSLAEPVRAKKIVLATGIIDQIPDIDGFAPCWGVSILHCPYCHGYEVRGQKIGLLANGDAGFDLTKLIGHWTNNLTLLTQGPATFTPDQRQFIDKRGVPVIESAVSRIIHQNGQLQQVQFADGNTLALDAMFTRLAFRQSGPLVEQLGIDLLSTGMMAGLIAVNDFGKTNVPGVYAAGDNSGMRSLSVAIANGSKAGAALNRELIEEKSMAD